MNKKSKKQARLAKQLRAEKLAKDAYDAAMENEEETLRNLALRVDERGHPLELPKMSVKVRKRLKISENQKPVDEITTRDFD
jgi:hypothetical protein